MVTDRDKVALDFITQFNMVTASQADKIAYNNIKIAYNRLNRLHQDKLIYKTKNTVNKGFIYSTERVRTLKQFMHCYIRTEFYLHLKEISEVYAVVVDKNFGSIRPDLLISCMYNNSPYHFAVEVETNANHSSVNYEKYNNFFLAEYRNYFNVKPIIIYVTDKNIDSSKIHFEYRHIKTDLSNFEEVFR